MLPISREAEGYGLIVVSTCVAETILAFQGQLVFVSELGHRVGEHGHLLCVIVPDEVTVPLTPRFRLEFLRRAFLVDFCDFKELLADQVLMKVPILERLLFVFLSLAEDRRCRV